MGALSVIICYQFIKMACHPFPNFANKYQHKALLTPEQFLERYKAEGKFPICSPPKTVILCFDEAFLQTILQKYPNQPCADVYLLTEYPSVAITKFGMGASLNVMRLEREIAWGIKQVIAIGTCCGLQKDLSLGDIIVCEKSIRDEGTSHHYLPYSKYAYPSDSLNKKVLTVLDEMKKTLQIGPKLDNRWFL